MQWRVRVCNNPYPQNKEARIAREEIILSKSTVLRDASNRPARPGLEWVAARTGRECSRTVRRAYHRGRMAERELREEPLSHQRRMGPVVISHTSQCTVLYSSAPSLCARSGAKTQKCDNPPPESNYCGYPDRSMYVSYIYANYEHSILYVNVHVLLLLYMRCCALICTV